MARINMRPGAAVLAAALIFWVGGTTQAQQAAKAPPQLLTLPEPPGGPTIIPASAVVPRVSPDKAPALPTRPSGVLPEPNHSAAAEPPLEASKSLTDIVVEASEGPSPANPTGLQEPGVSLQWICPPTVRLNQPVNCTIIVKSLSANRLHQVAVRYRIPSSVTFKGAEPNAVTEGDLVLWQLGSLEPRQEKRLDLHLVPTAHGPLACHAFVTFTGSASARIEVREPKLILAAAAAKQAIVGDTTSIALTVSNTGDAAAEHVKITANLSDGLQHPSGRTVEFELDRLGPNEGRTVMVNCAAKATGRQTCTAAATAEAGLKAEDLASIEVLAPQVQLRVSGPGMRYLERHAVFTFTVTNPGTAPASRVTLIDQVPPGFKVAGASDGGRQDFGSRSVQWLLETLQPGQSKEVTLDLVAVNPGEYKNKALVTAARGLRAEGEVQTRLEGLAGLLMELADVEDPVEVGKEDSYEVRVTNTGTKTETNLQLTCTIPEKMAFRAAKGPPGCDIHVEGHEVIFSPLSRLVPRADVIYRVTVQCLAPGDLRFKARVKADGLEQPVLREESTRVYGDERENRTPPTGN